MSFFMVHLQVAAQVYNRLAHADIDRRSFLLGAVAPDAIAFRPGCGRADKCRSHFTPPGFAWAQCTDNEMWTRCLHDGLLPYASFENQSFLLGYRIHVLTDIANNSPPWQIMRFLNPMDVKAVETDMLEHEARLLADFGGEEALFPQLTLTDADALGDLATADDIARMLGFIKNELYRDRPPNPAHPFVFKTPADLADFIQNTAAYITEVL